MRVKIGGRVEGGCVLVKGVGWEVNVKEDPNVDSADVEARLQTNRSARRRRDTPDTESPRQAATAEHR